VFTNVHSGRIVFGKHSFGVLLRRKTCGQAKFWKTNFLAFENVDD